MKKIFTLMFAVSLFAGLANAQLLGDFDNVFPTIGGVFSPNGDYTVNYAANPSKDEVNPSDTVFGGASVSGTWEGFYFSFAEPFDFSNSTTFKMLVYGQNAGIARMKLEDSESDASVALNLDYTETNNWQELVFEFDASIATGHYDVMTICLDNGSNEVGNIWYIDYIIGPNDYDSSDDTGVDVVSSSATNCYPNPCSDALTIQSGVELSSVELFNLVGKKVMTKCSVNATTVDFETNELTGGVYIVKVVDVEGKVSISKITKN